MKGMNIIQLNALHLNVVLLNGDEMPGEVVVGGGEVVPVPPTEPETPDVPVEPKKFILSASVANGVVSATLNGVVVSLPYTANEGDVIVVSVTPNDGYEFNGWNDGNTDNPRTITMTADVALSAQCVEVVQPPVGNYIQFEDAEVERVLMSKGISSDGVGITMEDAAKVTSIGKWFQNNTTITSFDELQYFTGVAFLGVDTSSYNGGAFNGCTNLRNITLPKSVKAIRNGSFMNCTSLRTIGGLENVEEIRNRAFYGCSQWNEDVEFPSLTSLVSTTFTNSGIKGFSAAKLSSIAGSDNYNFGAFSNCDALTKVSIPMVADVGRVAFSLCDNLEEIELPSATAIGVQAFYGCSKLKKIICRATTPPTLGGVNAFSSTNSALVIYVPDASLEAYRTATNWNSYADRIHPLSEIEGVVIEYGYELTQRGNLVENDNHCVVGFVKCDVGISVRWGVTSGSYGRLCEYDSTEKWVDFWDARGGISRTITISSNSSLLKATFRIDYVDNAYIYDETNGKYLWKGANVE